MIFRVVYMDKKKHLAQYYTPKEVADILASRALLNKNFNASKILDLAAGDGQLIKSFLSISPESKGTAVDIDPDNISELLSLGHNIQCIEADAMQPSIFKEKSLFELGLANPPFLDGIIIDRYKKSLVYQHLKLNLAIGQKVRSEFIFICQYLNYLEEDGILSIILPATLISGSKCQSFRESLLQNYELIEVYQVTDSVFQDTEADTFVLTLRKRKPSANNVILRLITPEGNVTSEVKVKISALEKRMDPRYFILSRNEGAVKLGDVAEIKRGSVTHKELKESYTSYIHTTNFDDEYADSSASVASNHHVLINGDVIMCRVGTRVIGKTKEFLGNNLVFSDCIYRLRFSTETYKKSFLHYINTQTGQNEIKRLSKGVCSKYLPVSELKSFCF